jgi:Putative adhesin
MKYFSNLIIALLVLASGAYLATPAVLADRPSKSGRPDDRTQVDQSTEADQNVSLSVCLVSGDIRVRGWGRNQIRARSRDADGIEFKRPAGARDSEPAKEVSVLITDAVRRSRGPCLSDGDIELDVPFGASLHLQTRDGDIHVVNVASVYANSIGNDIDLSGIKRLADATTIGGGIALRNSSGIVKLRSVGGRIETRELTAGNERDSIEVNSVGGDITLDSSGYANVKAVTVDGELNVTGSLGRAARCDLKSLSGNLNLVLPSDASFRLDAKLSRSGDFTSDFPNMNRDAGYGLQHINGTYGTGDALINLSSFSGAIHLRKK